MRLFWFCIITVCSFGILATVHTKPAITPLITHTDTAKNPHDISIGWLGDIVPAADDETNNAAFSYISFLTKHPSLMIGNLEGTFAKETRVSKCTYMQGACHAFRGNPLFAYTLKDSGFDLITLTNNHSYDYGDEGHRDTEIALENAGIPYISQTKPSTTLLVNGKKVGVLGVSFTPPLSTITDYTFIAREIAALRQTSDIVILIFHGGAEGINKTAVTGKEEYLGNENRGNVELVARTAIDAGADIVLGSGPHVLRKVEYYNNRPIVYSAGNAFGGNQRLTTTGILGISALFTITEHDNIFTHTVTPLILSKSGIPSIDTEGRALQLIKELSQ
jgi:poly-gamma-glutamate capsule biosynthesis protein CapA/YwtB (metallophosphatase superfamily)